MLEGRKFIKQAYRVLRNKGIIFLVTPNRIAISKIIQAKKRFKYDPTHVTYYTPFSLAKLLARNNFLGTTFTFRAPKCTIEDWALPLFLQEGLKKFSMLVNWILISSPLALLRDSFWVLGRKN